MSDGTRKGLRLGVAVVSGVFCLPSLIFGLYFLLCWIRIHTSDVYYVEYPYFRAAAVFLAIGLVSICFTLFSVKRRSFFGAGFVFPLFFGLATMVYIPDGTPHVQKCLVDDSNYVGDVQSFFRVWYESHHSFPKDKTEFLDALRTGPAAWQFRISSPSAMIDYSKKGVRLPYEIVVVQNASGPRMDDLSERPGVIYYWVANDQQRFWVAMTELSEDVSRSSNPKLVSWPSPNRYVIAVDGRDYPVRHGSSF